MLFSLSFLQSVLVEFLKAQMLAISTHSAIIWKVAIVIILIAAIALIAYATWKWISQQEHRQKHRFNISATINNFKIQKQDIFSMQQWDDHKKSEFFRRISESMFTQLKLNVVDMRVKLSPKDVDLKANDGMIVPLMADSETNVEVDIVFQNSLKQSIPEMHACKQHAKKSNVNSKN